MCTSVSPSRRVNPAAPQNAFETFIWRIASTLGTPMVEKESLFTNPLRR